MFRRLCQICFADVRYCTCQQEPAAPPEKPKPDPSVGSWLLENIPSWLGEKDCGCEEYAEKLDRWGSDGCEERMDEIVEYFAAKAQRIKGLPKQVTRPGARALVSMGIQACRQGWPEKQSRSVQLAASSLVRHFLPGHSD